MTEVYCTEGMCKFLKGGICTKDEIRLIHDECRSFESEETGKAAEVKA